MSPDPRLDNIKENIFASDDVGWHAPFGLFVYVEGQFTRALSDLSTGFVLLIVLSK